MKSNTVIVAVLLIINIPLYLWFFRFFFRNTEEFKKAITFLFRPGLVSIVKGEYWDNVGVGLKASMYIVMCGVVIFIEFTLIEKLITLLTN